MAEDAILLSKLSIFQAEMTKAKGTTAEACSGGSKDSKEAVLTGAE